MVEFPDTRGSVRVLFPGVPLLDVISRLGISTGQTSHITLPRLQHCYKRMEVQLNTLKDSSPGPPYYISDFRCCRIDCQIVLRQIPRLPARYLCVLVAVAYVPKCLDCIYVEYYLVHGRLGCCDEQSCSGFNGRRLA